MYLQLPLHLVKVGWNSISSEVPSLAPETHDFFGTDTAVASLNWVSSRCVSNAPGRDKHSWQEEQVSPLSGYCAFVALHTQWLSVHFCTSVPLRSSDGWLRTKPLPFSSSFLETWSRIVIQASFKYTILLPLSSKFWGGKYASPPLVSTLSLRCSSMCSWV